MTDNNIMIAAREAIGTPFLKKGRSEIGLDCFGLVICCAKKLNLPSCLGGFIHQYDILNYDLRNNSQLLQDFFTKHFLKTNDLADGNFIIFQISEQQYHVAIKASLKCEDTIIHSFFPARSVVEHSLSSYWKDRIHSIFKI